MYKSLATIWAYVSDMDRSVAYYRDLLGMKPVHLTPYWSSFELGGGAMLGLHPTSAAGQTDASGGWRIGFVVDDLASLKAKLEAAGARTGDYHDTPSGVVMDIYDPDGNMLQPMQPGATAATLLAR